MLARAKRAVSLGGTSRLVADDRFERVDRLGPDALRDAELREREQRRHVLRRRAAHPAHGVDGHGQVLELVAGDARDLGAEHDDRVGRASPDDRRAKSADEPLALALLEEHGGEAARRRGSNRGRRRGPARGGRPRRSRRSAWVPKRGVFVAARARSSAASTR